MLRHERFVLQQICACAIIKKKHLAGGSYENRWCRNIALLCVNEMGVTIDEQDDAAHQLHFHNKKKIMQLAMQSLDEETVQVIMDSTKERLQIYNWKREDKEVNQFYELFEKKLTEYRAFILCPNCSAKISSLVKFCPECGCKVK